MPDEPRKEALDQYIFQKFAASIDTWSQADVYDVYATTIWTDFYSRWCWTAHLGYNTERNYRQNIDRASSSGEAKLNYPLWFQASSPGEARWNYAFWLHEDRATVSVFADDYDDYAAESIWTREADYIAAHLNELNNPNLQKNIRMPYKDFVEACVRAGRALHDSGIIQAKLGKLVPVLMLELEYYDPIIERTRHANPSGVAQEFIDWYFTELSAGSEVNQD
jgi:hypothetical protein